MNALLSIIVPQIRNGKPVEVEASIRVGEWTTDDPVLRKTLGYLHLDTGHHADRDLELAMMAVRYLGGEVRDRRPKPKNVERLPR